MDGDNLDSDQVKKKCTKCGKEKPLTDFSPHRRAPLGRQPRCRSCCTKRHRETRERIRATKQYVIKTEKKCSTCKKTRPIGDFRCATGSPDGKHGVCCDCEKEDRKSISNFIRAAKAEQKD